MKRGGREYFTYLKQGNCGSNKYNEGAYCKSREYSA